jgi:hypothetical protein
VPFSNFPSSLYKFSELNFLISVRIFDEIPHFEEKILPGMATFPGKDEYNYTK